MRILGGQIAVCGHLSAVICQPSTSGCRDLLVVLLMHGCCVLVMRSRKACAALAALVALAPHASLAPQFAATRSTDTL
jgi:hypothetical protein